MKLKRLLEDLMLMTPDELEQDLFLCCEIPLYENSSKTNKECFKAEYLARVMEFTHLPTGAITIFAHKKAN